MRTTLKSELLAKAPIDECFNGIGEPYIPGPECTGEEIPKANQSYLWGLAKAGDNLWFGTAANMICLVRAASDFLQLPHRPPYQNSLWSCEFDDGQYPRTQLEVPVPGIFSDYRPPQIFTYNTANGALTDMSARISSPDAQRLLQTTFGLRSAVSFKNLVFLAGPKSLGQGINMFVFKADSGELVAAQTLTEYQNIRKWLILDGVLYTTVADRLWNGRVLRWTGSAENPFSFEEVGRLDTSGAEITFHNGRLFVGTWPTILEKAGIWMSPMVPEGGLTQAQADGWIKVWQSDDYEPDPLNAAIYGVGAMMSYGGYLYWGTMNVEGKAAPIFVKAYQIKPADYLKTFLKTRRATAIFRCQEFDGTKPLELLYGDATLPVYVPTGVSEGLLGQSQKQDGRRPRQVRPSRLRQHLQ